MLPSKSHRVLSATVPSLLLPPFVMLSTQGPPDSPRSSEKSADYVQAASYKATELTGKLCPEFIWYHDQGRPWFSSVLRLISGCNEKSGTGPPSFLPLTETPQLKKKKRNLFTSQGPLSLRERIPLGSSPRYH